MRKLSLLICLFVYRTVVLYVVISFKIAFAGGSAAFPIDPFHYSIFTILFTLIELVLFGVFHKDISHSISHRLRTEYKPSISNKVISYK